MHLMEAGAVSAVLTIKSELPLDYAVFALPWSACGVSEDSSGSHPSMRSDDPLLVACEAASSSEVKVFAVSRAEHAMIGWARTTLPPYVK